MSNIYLLTARRKSYFGDEEELTKVVGWTSDLSVARKWLHSGHMMEHRNFETVKEVTVDTVNNSVVVLPKY